MSVEALFTVRYEEKSHQVEVSYNPGKYVAGVKELIVTKLRSNFDGFEDVKAGYLTLRTLDGDVIEGARMPEGDKFLADLNGSSVAKHPKSNYLSDIRFTTFLFAIDLTMQPARTLGKRDHNFYDWFPDDFRVCKKTKAYDDDEIGEYSIESNIDVIDMRDFPPMVNFNPEYSRVYVRPCYVTLFANLVELITEGRFNAMVTGNPGIGKSYFYLYAIFRFIKDPSLLGKWRLLINSGEHFHILNGDTFEAIDPPEILAIQSEKDILRLVDGKTTAGQLTGWKGSTVLIASLSNYSPENKPTHLMKNYESYYFFMPVWNDEELKDTNELLDVSLRQSEAELMEKVELVGHIPRFVLSKKTTLDMLLVEVKAVLNTANLLDMLHFVEGKNGVGDNHYSHRLLKMVPINSSHTVRAGYSLDFVSRGISRLALIESEKHVVAEFKKFALSNKDSDSAEFSENAYEYLIHRLFKIAPLQPLPEILEGKRLSDGSEFEITLPLNIDVKESFQKLEDIVLVLDQALYAFPSSKTQGAYDSFLWNGVETCYIFRITIAKEHSILYRPIKRFLEWIRKFDIAKLDIKFVFIVPTRAIVDQWNQPQKLVKSNGTVYQNEGNMVPIDQHVVILDMVDRVTSLRLVLHVIPSLVALKEITERITRRKLLLRAI